MPNELSSEDLSSLVLSSVFCYFDTMNEVIVEQLRVKYANIHPLIFHRSVERASTEAELFDILDTLPEHYPVAWDTDAHRWHPVHDITMRGDFDVC